MEGVNEKSLKNEIFDRLADPVKYKLKFFQIIILMYVDQIVAIVASKYLVLRILMEENKPKFQHNEFLSNKRNYINYKKSFLDLIRTFKLKIQEIFEKFQSMNEETHSHQETPELFCEPYIHTGFRPINRPYSYYAKSLFSKHNETINAWSHYIGCFFTLSFLFQFDFSDPYSWPILITIFTSAIMFFTSATAHLLHGKSHYTHMTCFLCDFGGISFNAFGGSLIQIYLCSPIWFYKAIEPYLIPILGFQSAMCLFLNSLAQTNYKRPYPPIKRFLQFAPCGALWAFSMFTLVIPFIWNDSNETESLKINYAYHVLHTILFLIGAAFFAGEFPQRFFPGKVDFFGQGHHWFHLCVFSVVVLQIKTCYMDFLENRNIIAASRQPPTLYFCLLPVITLGVYYVYLIRCFHKMISHNFDKNGNLITNKTECTKCQ